MTKDGEYMKKIIFATSNEGKMKEIREILKDLDTPLLSLKDAGLNPDIDENGTSFEENAVIKAKQVMEMTGEIVLADDSGIEIDYLDKAPGVYSARFLGEDTPYSIKNQYIIDQLAQAEDGDRSARFVCVIACALPDGKIMTCRGTIEGFIAKEISGENGFGYDPIFYVPEYGCTTAQMLPEQKNEISHRGKALKAMKEKLRKYI
jgi:XTP/dITP diphosphohydrolase